MYGAPVGSNVYTSGTTIVPVGFAGRIFNINIFSSGTSPAITFYTAGSGVTSWLDAKGVNRANDVTPIDYGVNGVWFPNGIYMTPDSNVVRVTVSYRKEESNT